MRSQEMKIKTYCSKKSYLLISLAINKDIIRVRDQLLVNIQIDTKNCDLEISKI